MYDENAASQSSFDDGRGSAAFGVRPSAVSASSKKKFALIASFVNSDGNNSSAKSFILFFLKRLQPERVTTDTRSIVNVKATIISRINGFTFVETSYDPYTNTVTEVERIAYSEGLRAKVNCYGANSVPEGVAIMWKENVDVSITGNSTNPTRFQHPVAGTYKKERLEAGKKYFSVASGGGTGRTLHPDNMAAGPASYGFTDTLGRMHSDAQFAGSSSVPAHVEMMGLIGMGNNPMVGATVAVAVSIEEAAKAGKF